MALVWSNRGGDVRVRSFPPMKGVEPPVQPTQTRVEAFGALPVGPEPPCEEYEDPDDPDDPEDPEVPEASASGPTSSSAS